jgi:VCBS repeat-containing protein
MEWMSLAPHDMYHNSFLDREHDVPMLESCLTFLATLMTVRTNLGKSQNVTMTITGKLEWNLLKVTCVIQVLYFK